MKMLQTNFVVEFAGLTIEVETVSPSACILCYDYLSNGKPDFKVSINEEDIRYEQLENAKCGRNNTDVYSQTIAVYRKIVEKTLEYDMILLHGAVIAVGGEAYLFTAPSGVGKTTHIKQWLANLSEAFVVNGDKPLIKITDMNAIACGTPWCGNEHLGTNTMVPLKAIVILERSEDNSMEEISFLQAYKYLIQETYLPEDISKAKTTLKLLKKLEGKVSFWYFRCNNFKDDCFKTAYDTLVN